MGYTARSSMAGRISLTHLTITIRALDKIQISKIQLISYFRKINEKETNLPPTTIFEPISGYLP